MFYDASVDVTNVSILCSSKATTHKPFCLESGDFHTLHCIRMAKLESYSSHLRPCNDFLMLLHDKIVCDITITVWIHSYTLCVSLFDNKNLYRVYGRLSRSSKIVYGINMN